MLSTEDEVTRELPGLVTAVSWGAEGRIAAAARGHIAVFFPESAHHLGSTCAPVEASDVFPFAWSVAACIPWQDDCWALEWSPCGGQLAAGNAKSLGLLDLDLQDVEHLGSGNRSPSGGDGVGVPRLLVQGIRFIGRLDGAGDTGRVSSEEEAPDRCSLSYSGDGSLLAWSFHGCRNALIVPTSPSPQLERAASSGKSAPTSVSVPVSEDPHGRQGMASQCDFSSREEPAPSRDAEAGLLACLPACLAPALPAASGGVGGRGEQGRSADKHSSHAPIENENAEPCFMPSRTSTRSPAGSSDGFPGVAWSMVRIREVTGSVGSGETSKSECTTPSPATTADPDDYENLDANAQSSSATDVQAEVESAGGARAKRGSRSRISAGVPEPPTASEALVLWLEMGVSCLRFGASRRQAFAGTSPTPRKREKARPAGPLISDVDARDAPPGGAGRAPVMHVLVALDCGGTLYSLVCHSRAAHARAGEEGLGGGVAGHVAGHERVAPWICHLAVYGWASVPPGSGVTGGSQEQKAGEGCSAEGTGTGFLFDLIKKPRPARSPGGAGAWEGRGQGGRPGSEMGMAQRMGASGTNAGYTFQEPDEGGLSTTVDRLEEYMVCVRRVGGEAFVYKLVVNLPLPNYLGQITRSSMSLVATHSTIAGTGAGDGRNGCAASSQHILAFSASCVGIKCNGRNGHLVAGDMAEHESALRADSDVGLGQTQARSGGSFDSEEAEGSIRLIAAVGCAGRVWLGAWWAATPPASASSFFDSPPAPQARRPQDAAAPSAFPTSVEPVDDAYRTEAVPYLGHSSPVQMLCCHAIQPLVATCSLSGEVLLWRTAGHTRLEALAAVAGQYSAVAWSPPLEPDAALWDAGLLWAFSCASRGGKAQLHALAVATTSCAWNAADARKGMLPQSSFDAQILEENDLGSEVLLQVVAVDDEEARSSSQPAQHASSTRMVIAAWGAGLHVWRARVGVNEHGAHCVEVANELAPHPLARPAVALSTSDHLDRSWRQASHDAALPREQLVVCGSGEWVEVCMVHCGGVRSCRRLWLGSMANVIDIFMLSHWEMLLLVDHAAESAATRSSGAGSGPGMPRALQTRPTGASAVAYVVECKSHKGWRVETRLPLELSCGARARGLLTGDGSVLLSVVDNARVHVLAPEPWTWSSPMLPASSNGVVGGRHDASMAETGSAGHVDLGHSRGSGLLEEEPGGPRAFVRTWSVFGEVDLACHPALPSGDDCHSIPSSPSALSTVSCASKEGVGPPSVVGWVADGSIVVQSGGAGLLMLGSGQYEPFVKRKVPAEGASETQVPGGMKQRFADGVPQQDGGLDGSEGNVQSYSEWAASSSAASPAALARETADGSEWRAEASLWSAVDAARGGASVVFYHPTLVMHCILAGQVVNAATRLKGLLEDLEGSSGDADELGLGAGGWGRNLGNGSAPEILPSTEPAVLKDSAEDGRVSSVGGWEGEGKEDRSKGEDDGRGSGVLKRKLDGVDLNGVKRIVDMKVAEETKMKALAKLFVREPRLVDLLGETLQDSESAMEGADEAAHQRRVWDGSAGVFVGPPAWENISSTIDAICRSRLETASTESSGILAPEVPGGLAGEHNSVNTAQGQAAGSESHLKASRAHHGMQHLHQVLTLEEVKSLGKVLEGLLTGAGHHATRQACSSDIVLLGVDREALDELRCIVAAFEALLHPGVAAGLDVPGAVGFLHFRTQVLLHGRRRASKQGAQSDSVAHESEVHVWGKGGEEGRGGHEGVQSEGKEAVMADPPLGCISLCMPCHSEVQDTLLGVTSSGGEGSVSFGGDTTASVGAIPPELCELWLDFSPGLWVKSTAQLRALIEQVARARFQKRREPMDAALWYVLARKTRQLSALFKANSETKVATFLLRDFENDESARSSACKNAFSLLAKHQTLGALAFFVLAWRIDDALNLLVINLRDIHLAVLLVRLAAQSPQHETALLAKLFHETILPLAEARQDRGMIHLSLWLLSRPAAAAAALWIRDPSMERLSSIETKASASRAPGLLSRLTAEEDAQQRGAREEVGDAVHPSVLGLLQALQERYRHLRGAWEPVPDGELRVVVARALLDDGCASLAAPVLVELRRGSAGARSAVRADELVTEGDGVGGRMCADGSVEALCVNVCLAQVSELIRAEGSRQASTGQNQVDLSRFKKQLKMLVGALDVDLSSVTPLLVRFALSRGFWRLGHALVTGSWQGSNTSRDSALACVAVHPLTSSLAGSIADFTAEQVACLDRQPQSVLSAIERKGKFLQLILHGLTVANDGNTGALAILASCVMITHFVLLCARRDLEALRVLMLKNEGIADQDNAAALAWLMQACHPALFEVGASADTRELGSTHGSSQDAMQGQRGRSSQGVTCQRACVEVGSEDLAAENGGQEGNDVLERTRLLVAEKCLMWVLLERFRGRMLLALTAPLQDPQSSSSRHASPQTQSVQLGGRVGNDNEALSTEAEGEIEPEDEGDASDSQEDDAGISTKKGLEGRRMTAGTGAPSTPSSATKMLAGVTSGWQKLKSSSRPRSFNSIKDHLKDAMHRAQERTSDLASLVSSPASASSPFTPRRRAATSKPSLSSFTPTLSSAASTPASAPGSSQMNLGRYASAGQVSSARGVADGGIGLPEAEPRADISTVIFFSDKWGDGGAKAWQKRAPQLLGRRLLVALRNRSQRMKDQLSAALRSLVLRGVSASLSKHVTPWSPEKLFPGGNLECSQELWAHYKCETLLAQLADEVFGSRPSDGRGVWQPSVSERLPQRCRLGEAFRYYDAHNSMLQALRSRVVFTGVLHIHLIEGSGLIAVDQLSLTDVLSGQDSSKPTTYVVFQFDGAADASRHHGNTVPRATSKIVKRSDKPHYDEWLHVAICDQRCTAHVEVMEKHSFRELVLGCAHLDLARLVQAQASELQVELARPDGELPLGVVGLLKCCFRFDFEAKLLS